MKKILLSVISLLLITLSSFGQYQTYNWYVGPNTYLDFQKSGDINQPVPFISASGKNINSNISMLSDSSGQLIIYIENDTVYFPTTGDHINPITSATYSPNQPFIVNGVQDINGIIYFEIFSLASISPSGYDLYYSAGNVDHGTLNLDYSNTLISGFLSSKMAVYRTSNKTIVVTHDISTDQYKIFNNFPTSDNFSLSFGLPFGGTIGSAFDDGYFKFSPSGKYFAATSPSQQELKVFTFDTLTNNLSNELTLDSKHYNAIEFAAGDENIVYVSADKDIYQIKINTTQLTNYQEPVESSQSLIKNMQLGIDGKIYVAKESDSYLGAIINPEIPDDACFYEDEHIFLVTPSNGFLPAFPANYFKQMPTFYWTANFILYDTPVNFEIFSPEIPDSSYWDFGNGIYKTFSSNSFSQNIKLLGERTFKIVLFYNNLSSNLWDSLVFTRKTNITLTAGMHLISPFDTIICDTLNDFTVHVDYPDENRKFIWTSQSGSFNLTTSSTDIQISHPDTYYLEIQDTLYNFLAYDTLYVKQFTPYLNQPTDSIFILNSNINFDVQLIQKPDNFIDLTDLDFSWNFGDGSTIQNAGESNIDYTYSNTGDYYMTVDISGANCSYNLSKSIFITTTDTIIDGTHFLNPNEFTLCDTTKDHILIKVPYTNYPFNIHWYYYGTELTNNYNNNELITSKPGKYYVEIFDGASFHARDSVFVHYKLCQDIDLNLLVNDVSDNYSNCEESSEINFYTEIQSSDPCSVDITKFKYYWYFGDNTTFEGTNIQQISHKYSSPGVYVVQLFVIDEKNCQHSTRRTVYIQEQTADTIYISATEKDAFGDYIFDFSKNGVLAQTFYERSTFIAPTPNQDFANSGETFSLEVQTPYDIYLNDPKDITVFINFALWDDFTANVFSPSGTSVNLANINSVNNYMMFGQPGTDYNDYLFSYPKTYFFNDNGAPIDDMGDGILSNSYFSPIEIMYNYDFYFLPNGTYKFDNAAGLTGKKIGGTWNLFIQSSGRYGKIVSWGIKFNPELFKIEMLPDYLYCYDEEGNVYDATNLQLKVTDLGGTNNILNCEIHYPNTNCTIKKTLIIEFPEIQNVLTPNGDGINDYWMPVSATSGATIVVIDKVGRVVANFLAEENQQGWDGTYNNQSLPSDSYWYIVTLQNGRVLKGVITIVR